MDDFGLVEKVSDYNYQTLLGKTLVALNTDYYKYIGTLYDDVYFCFAVRGSGTQYCIAFAYTSGCNFGYMGTPQGYTGTVNINIQYGNFYYGLLGITNYNANYRLFSNLTAALEAISNFTPITYYPINYTRIGCTLTAPVDAAPGQDCVVIVNPSEGYTFKGSSGVRIQDSSGANVPFIVSGNRISFTYPQPI